MKNPVAKVTIDDVARIAGVSVSTVSRTINNRPDVAKRTRERILHIIDELGYEPHLQAQSLAAGQPRTIALLFPIEHKHSTQLELDFVLSASYASAQQNHNFNLITLEINADRLLNLYRRSQVAGVILMQIKLDDWRVQLLKEHDLPFVMIGRTADDTGLNSIDFDFEAGVELAFRQLYDLGHREIGFLTRPAASRVAKLGSASRLMAGYVVVRDTLGLTEHVREADLNIDAMYAAAEALLAEGVTAMVTVNGATVPGVFRAAGYDFPVVGIATEKTAELVTPRLTAVEFPSSAMGAQAAAMLIERMMNPDLPPEQIILPPRLVERDSTRRLS